MARPRSKTRSSAQPAEAQVDPHALAVHATPERARLELLEKQQRRLLRDITKRKQALASLQAIADEVMRDLCLALLPVKREMEETVGSMRRLFEGLLNDDQRLRRRDKKAAAEIYENLLLDLPYELRVATNPPPPKDSASAGHGFRGAPPRGADDPWPDPEEYFGAEAGPEAKAKAEAGYSAVRPEGEQAAGLRALFKRLVTRLHPDKVQDDTTKAERTETLKEVTQAYESGDLAKLLEIERDLALEVLSSSTSLELTERARRLVSANKELRAQLRELTKARKQLRDELPFHLDLRSPSRLREQAAAQAEELIEGARAELDGYRELRDFVQRFVDGKMSIRDFLAGPASPDAIEELMSELFDEVVNQVVSRQPARRRRGRRRKR